MKSSLIFAATSAIVAVASPVEKRDYVTDVDVVVEYTTVTVGADSPAPPAATTTTQSAVFVNGGKHRNGGKKPSSTSTTVQEPATTQQPVVYVTQTIAPEQPATTEAAATTEVASTYQAAAATTATTAQAAAPSDMASTALYAHNLHRANHSAPALTWLDEIAGYAQNTANTCKFAHDMTEGAGNYGQNIAMWATSDNAAALGEAGAIGMASHDMWYNGEYNTFLPSYYGESTPDMSNFEAWGHFSQLVWKDSTSLGCSAKLCPKGTMYDDMDAWYMVCNYRPAGNVGGGYGSNVLKSLGEATVSN